MNCEVSAWLFPILGSALLLGIYDIAKKQAVKENAVMPALFWATFTGSTCFLLLCLARGHFSDLWLTGRIIWFPVLIKAMIVSASWTCIYYAMRELPISIASPIRASSPLGVFIGGLLIYGEIPTPLQGFAMLLIFSGYYLFSVFGKLEGFSFRNCRGIHLIFLGTVCGVGAALYDKYLLGVQKYHFEAVQFWFSIFLVAVIGCGCLIRYTFFRHTARTIPFRFRWSIPLTGILLICADYLYFFALSQPDTQVSILSLVRRSNCIVSFVAGSIFFHERNKLKKAVAMTVILLGILLLAWK